jgi:hypothetical protein
MISTLTKSKIVDLVPQLGVVYSSLPVNNMQVKELTVEELKILIQETVAETIQSILLDPDQDKEVKPEVKQQLLDSLRRTKKGERGISAEEVAKKLGLNW